MEFRYATETKEIKALKERLRTLSLAYKMIEGHACQVPSFVDCKSEYLGCDKMHAYLDQLDREKEQWYYCNC